VKPRALTTSLVTAGWLLLAAFVVGVTLSCRVVADVRAFQVFYLVGFLGYALLCWLVAVRARGSPPGRWRWWLAGCIASRACLLAVEPSDDAYRYVWEGRVQRAGLNPFSHAPDDDRLAPLRDRDWARINHPDYAAIYPPIAQMEFLLIAAVCPSVFAVKALHVVWDILVLAVLGACLKRTGRPPHAAVAYGLCPLVLAAFAMEGHVDSLMLLFVALSLWGVLADKPWFAGAMLGAAIAAKLIPAVLLPWFLLRRPAAAALAVGVAGLCYLPYVGAGTDLFASLTRFGASGTILSLLPTLGVTRFASAAERGAVAAALGVTIIVLAVRCRDFTRYGAAATGALLMLMPIVHFWYFSWALLYAALLPRVRWMVGAAAMVGYFEAEAACARTDSWSMPPAVATIVWGAVLLTWAVEALLARRDRAAQV